MPDEDNIYISPSERGFAPGVSYHVAGILGSPERAALFGNYYLGRPIESDDDFNQAFSMMKTNLVNTGQWDPTGIFGPLAHRNWLDKTTDAISGTFDKILPQNDRMYLDPLLRAVAPNVGQPSMSLDQLPVLGAAAFGGAAASGALGGTLAAGGGTAGGTTLGAEGALAGSTANAAPLASAGVSAPVGTSLATGAQQATIADLVASGMSQEAATAAVMSGGESLSAAGALGGAGGLSSLFGSGGSGTGTTYGIPNNVLQGILQGGLGYLGAAQQSDAFRDVANQNLALGAPYRGILQQSYQPGFDLMSQPGYGDAFNRAADISARSYSAKFGNPADSPSAQAGILNDVWSQNYLPALSNYRGQLGQFGGFGLSTAGQAQLGGAGVAGGGLNALGYAAGTILNPPPNYMDLLRQYGGQPNYSINIGGTRY